MLPESPDHDPILLSPSQYRAALALAQAMIPPGKRIPGAGPETITRMMAFVQDLGPVGGRVFGQAVEAFDWAAIAYAGRRLHALDSDARERVMRRFEESSVLRWPLFLMGSLIKVGHFDSTELYGAYGVEFPKGGPAEPVRWLSQVQSGDDWDDDEEIECDAVVVGTGCGGAIVGKELAEMGHAVVFLEEGSLHRRDAFNGSALRATRHFYRGHGTLSMVGNTVVPVLMGKLVGGSTAINTGTSFRTPPWVLEEWCEKLSTDELTPDRMKPHFERVERAIQLAPAPDKYIGPLGEVIKRGADRLGWNHFNVERNAPDCDGSGFCDWGCSSGARLSMDVTYIPKALARGAVLFTETEAQRVVVENGRAVGVVGESTTRKRRVRVRARVVVIAGGAVPTPVMLLKQGICNASGQLGRNLSIHPGVPTAALFDEPLEVYKYIPQGVGVDQFIRQGLLMSGVGLDINVAPNAHPIYGRRLTRFMDVYDRVATMGVLAKDSTQNGRVRPGPGGVPLITYWLQKADLDQIREGTYRMLQLLFAAGAVQGIPLGHRMPVIKNVDHLQRYRNREAAASDYVWTVFHPLGTARMGHDPRSSVVGLDHETHDVKNLFLVDGSTVPGPLGVNPQITIMAMADRAAPLIGDRLD